VPREDVDMTQEQPLPWRASEVYVSFAGRAARTCRVTRHPGDLVRVELDGLDVLPGTLAEIQWTQDGRGSYAVGTVVPTPASSGPGVYISVTESVSGIQRRLGARFEVHVPVALTVDSKHVFAGRTEDLSTGGAHVTIDLTGDDGEAARRFADEIASGAHVVTELTLPDGPARFTCLVAAVGSQQGDLRLRFVDVDCRIEERLAGFLREAQRTIALEQAKSG
jgi:hypothetical protein